jgi:predicted ATP-grasp superfamily ATP-dependent carboligase
MKYAGKNIPIKMDVRVTHSVFILNLSYTGLAIARAFKGTGIKVYGFASKRWAPGNYSKHLQYIPSPDSMLDGPGLLDLLTYLAKQDRVKPLLFPTRDQDIFFIMQHRDIIDEYFMNPLPPNDTLAIILDKYRLYKLSLQCGIPVPRTILLESSQLNELLVSDLRPPLVVKPLYSPDWQGEGTPTIFKNKKAIFVHSTDHLLPIVNHLRTFKKNAILQEYVPGHDSDICTYCSYVNRKGLMLTYFNTRKIRQMPENLGIGAIVQTANTEDITETSVTLTQKLNFTGVSEIEYKRDPQSNKYILIEMNPRLWDQHSLSNSFGVNLPLVVYHDNVSNIAAVPEKRFSCSTWIAEERFLDLIFDKFLTKPATIFKLLREIKGPRTYATWDLGDPLPFFVSITNRLIKYAKTIFRKMFRRFSTR